MITGFGDGVLEFTGADEHDEEAYQEHLDLMDLDLLDLDLMEEMHSEGEILRMRDQLMQELAPAFTFRTDKMQ